MDTQMQRALEIYKKKYGTGVVLQELIGNIPLESTVGDFLESVEKLSEADHEIICETTFAEIKKLMVNGKPKAKRRARKPKAKAEAVEPKQLDVEKETKKETKKAKEPAKEAKKPAPKKETKAKEEPTQDATGINSIGPAEVMDFMRQHVNGEDNATSIKRITVELWDGIAETEEDARKAKIRCKNIITALRDKKKVSTIGEGKKKKYYYIDFSE